MPPPPHSRGALPGGSGPNLKLSRPGRLPLKVVVATTGVAAAAGALAHHRHTLRRRGGTANPLAHTKRVPGFLLPRELAEVLCGAVGEIVQVACLYPLDTIKVRCQTTTSSAGKVVADMIRSNGGILAPSLWRQLYAGVVSASVLSVAVGALYYSSFCAAKRHLVKWTAEGERHAAEKAALAGRADALPIPGSGELGAAAGVAGQQQQHGHHHGHGPPVDYHHDAFLALVCSDDAAAARAAARAEQAGQKQAKRNSRREQKENKQRGKGNNSSSSSERELAGKEPPSVVLAAASHAAAPAAATTSSSEVSSTSDRASSDVAEDSISGGGRLRANMAAATVAALIGAVIEAPVELFKHQLQAGQISGSILKHMGSAVRTGGPAALFVSMLPFCMKSLPFDSAELLTYSTLQDARDDLLAAPSNSGSARSGLRVRIAAAAQAVRDHPALDLSMGAMAGAVAVVVSMPMDTVKTVVETSGHVGGAGPAASAMAFANTGRQLVARHGPGALFSGMGMRLAEQVPSTALYWIAVEGMRRALEPYVAK